MIGPEPAIPNPYPAGCRSEFCPRVCCDGCASRPILVAFYVEQDRRAGGGTRHVDAYEARQEAARESERRAAARA